MFFVLLTYLAITSANEWKSELQDPWKGFAQDGVLGSSRNKRLVQHGGNFNNWEPIPCDRSDGQPGICVPMHKCLQEDLKNNLNKLSDLLCVLGKSNKIGVCCIDNSNEFGSLKLAGDLPATASLDEDKDVLLKISRSENRGCGFSTRPRDKLVGSGVAQEHEWPWMASITISRIKHFCGGTLITDRHVLTAAHCFKMFSISDIEVRLGEYDFTNKTESRTYIFKVIEKIQHEEYDGINFKNDIAIMKLDRPALFNTYVWPACLPPLGLELENQTTMLIGWGSVKFGGSASDVLLEIAIPIWEQKICIDCFVEAVFDENYCAGSYTGGRDACQYDSGSPLMYQMPSGRWTVIGIVSWGLGCGLKRHPGLYTRVDKYLPWIAANTQ